MPEIALMLSVENYVAYLHSLLVRSTETAKLS